MILRAKRVYDPPEPEDGCRLLVDRLWPRGLSREAAALDGWFREVAPSDELRRWFGHRADRWPEFQRRYADELDAGTSAVAELLGRMDGEPTVTLLFAARERERNNAQALVAYLRPRLGG